jgi:hypothetical protein
MVSDAGWVEMKIIWDDAEDNRVYRGSLTQLSTTWDLIKFAQIILLNHVAYIHLNP